MTNNLAAAESKREYQKFTVLNLAIIGASVIGAYLFTQFAWMDWMRVYMGLTWLVYAAFQLAGYKTFVHAFSDYDLIAKRIPGFAYAYPFIEIAWAGLYLFNYIPTIRDVSVLVIMLIGIAGIANSLVLKKRVVNCACLGSIIKLPLSRITLYEDSVMAVMAAIMLIAAT